MKRINEIFNSLQGEGHNTGRAAVFVRFAGCNLRCPFCDTDFATGREMSDSDIVEAVSAYDARFVVLTGGEPTLQADAALTARLHGAGFEIAMESNGTRPAPDGIDWLTISPKQQFLGEAARPVVRRCNELKCLFDGRTPVTDFGIEADYYYLQPCDMGRARRRAQPPHHRGLHRLHTEPPAMAAVAADAQAYRHKVTPARAARPGANGPAGHQHRARNDPRNGLAGSFVCAHNGQPRLK